PLDAGHATTPFGSNPIDGWRLGRERRITNREPKFKDTDPTPLRFPWWLASPCLWYRSIHLILEVRGGTQDYCRRRGLRTHSPGTCVHTPSPALNGLAGRVRSCKLSRSS